MALCIKYFAFHAFLNKLEFGYGIFNYQKHFRSIFWRTSRHYFQTLFAKRRLRRLVSFSSLQAVQINSKFITPTPQTKQGSGILLPLNLINKCLSQKTSLRSSYFYPWALVIFFFFSDNLPLGWGLEKPWNKSFEENHLSLLTCHKEFQHHMSIKLQNPSLSL